MSGIRRLALVLVVMVAALLAIGGGGLLWLQTSGGRDWLAGMLERLLSSPGQRLTVGAVTGTIPTDVGLDNVALADSAGVWLRVDHARLAWTPASLLRGEFHVTAIDLDGVDMLRSPKTPASSAPSGTPGLPQLPVSVVVDRLAVTRLHLAGPLLGGASATLQAEASAALGSHLLRLRLAAARTDGRNASVRLAAEFAPANDRLDLHLAARDAAGGLIAALLGRNDIPALSATLEGSGPLSRWRGRLAFDAGSGSGELGLGAELGVDKVAPGYRLQVAATASGLDGQDARRLLPAVAGRLAGPTPRLNATVTFGSDAVTVQPLTLDLAAGQARLQGRIATSLTDLDLAYRLDVPAGSPARALMPAARWQALTLDGRVRGPLSAPTVTASLAAAQPGFGAWAAAAAHLAARVAPAAAGHYQVTLDGSLAQPTGADQALAGLLGDQVRLSAAASVAPATGTVLLDHAGIDLATGQLAASGRADGWGTAGARLKLGLDVPALAPFAPVAGHALSGAAHLQAELTAKDGAVDGKFSGAARSLAVGVPAADAVLGGTLALNGRLARAADGTMSAEDVTLTLAHASLAAQARLAQGSAEAHWRIDMPDLAPLGRALAMALTGGLQLTGDLHGPVAEPEVDVVATGHDVSVAGHALAEPRLTAKAGGPLSAPQGRVALALGLGGRRIALSTRYALAGSRLDLPDLALSADDQRQIAGALTLDLASRTASGRIRGDNVDLSPFAALAGQKLSGRMAADLALSAPSGRQDAQLGLNLRNLALDAGQFAAAELQLDAKVSDALGTAAVQAALTGRSLGTARIGLDRLQATLKGGLADGDFTVDASGAAPALTLALNGRYAPGGAPGGRQITLARLSGRVDGQALSLATPARFDIGGGAVAGTGLDLAIDGGRLSGRFRLEGQRLDVQLQATSLPLALARMAQPDLGLAGRLDASVRLAGTTAAPEGEVQVTGRDIVTADLQHLGLRPARLTLSGQLHGGMLRAESRFGTAGSAIDLRASVAVPFRASAPGGPLAPTAPVSGRVTGTVPLESLNDLLAASGDRIGGRLDLDLTVGGTVAAPALGGAATLTGGRVEVAASGTVITGIRARLTGSGRTLKIAQFEGATPGGGRVRAEGQVVLDPGDAHALDIRLIADRAQLVQTDIATATIDGTVAATGSLASGKVAGALRLVRAEIQVPEQMPPSVVNLNPVVIDSAHPGAARAQGGPTARLPVPRRKPAMRTAARQPPSPVDGGSGGRNAAIPNSNASNAAGMTLAVTVSADNQVFVRGRGIDAELSGKLNIGGTTAKPQIAGRMSLIKGQLGVLGQTFTFTQGTITFLGGSSLEPVLDLTATSTAGDVTATIAVTGSVRSPSLTLSSSPELPQDEILARLLFNKSVGQLTAFQAVRLASSVAELAGFGGGTGIVDQVRQALGVDRLEVTGGSNGSGPGVAAGRYLDENVYVGVEQDVKGGSQATVQLDLTDHAKVDAKVGASTGNSVGLKFEWNY